MSSESNPKLYPINETVAQIGQIAFDGDIIPHKWYQFIKHKNGKPDMVAITLLAHFVYWYRPVQLLDSGRPVLFRKFKGDLLQKSYKELEEHFGFTMKQCKSAFYTLEALGLSQRRLQTIFVGGVKYSNVMFVEIFPDKIKQVTDIQCSQPCSQPSKKVKNSLPYGHRSTHPPDIEGRTNTETTSETTLSLKNLSNLNNRDCGRGKKEKYFKKERVSLNPSDLKRRFNFSDQQIDLVAWIEKIRLRAGWSQDQLDDAFITHIVSDCSVEEIENAIHKTSLKNPERPGAFLRSLLYSGQKSFDDYRAANVRKAEEFKKTMSWEDLKITKSQCVFSVNGKKVVFKNDIDPKQFELFLNLKYDEYKRMKKNVA